jgi:hypothetical protein
MAPERVAPEPPAHTRPGHGTQEPQGGGGGGHGLPTSDGSAEILFIGNDALLRVTP